MLKNVRLRRIILISLILLVAFSTLALISQCSGETIILNADMIIEIKSVNLENHVMIADVDLVLSGVQSLIIANEPQIPNFAYVKLNDINLDSLNCSLSSNFGNGTFAYHGTITDTSWYMQSIGEGYPFDINRVDFGVYRYSLEFTVNETRYGPDWQYLFNNNFRYVPQFSGMNTIDLKNTWIISSFTNDGVGTVLLQRNAFIPSFVILLPLFALLLVMIMEPSLNNNKSIKATFYSSILVFFPIFIFAIQGLIPPRSYPSIPEFLSIMLMILAALLFLASLRKGSEKAQCISDSLVFLSVYILGAFFAPFVFKNLYDWYPNIKNTLCILGIMLAAGFFIRVGNYIRVTRKEKKKKLESIPYSV
jgi:hypothetical protein